MNRSAFEGSHQTLRKGQNWWINVNEYTKRRFFWVDLFPSSSGRGNDWETKIKNCFLIVNGNVYTKFRAAFGAANWPGLSPRARPAA